MKRVWKFNIGVTTALIIRMPKGAQILTVQNQYGQASLWALVDPNEAHELRRIEVYETGEEITDGMGSNLVYISTVKFGGGDLVYHFFERIGI